MIRRRAAAEAVLILGALLISGPAEARDPELLCANIDAHRLEFKLGIGFYDPATDIFVRTKKGEPIASCETRSGSRTIFQRYEGGKVIQRGFFLQGKRSGRWIQQGSVTIYAGGGMIQSAPLTQCDPVAMVGFVLTVYCPRNTGWMEMISDFREWQRALTTNPRRIFDVFSIEAKTPTSYEMYMAVPEHSEINFATIQFEKDKVGSFGCIRAGEHEQRSCLDIVR